MAGATYGMLHNHEVSFVLERDTKISQESISWLTHNHGAEELTTKPGPASWRYRSLDDCNLEIGTSLAEHVGSAESTRTGTNDDNVGLGVRVKVVEVATGHSTA